MEPVALKIRQACFRIRESALLIILTSSNPPSDFGLHSSIKHNFSIYFLRKNLIIIDSILLVTLAGYSKTAHLYHNFGSTNMFKTSTLDGIQGSQVKRNHGFSYILYGHPVIFFQHFSETR